MKFANHNDTALYVAVVMACGFITSCSLPDGIPSLVRLTMMVFTRFVLGRTLRREGPG